MYSERIKIPFYQCEETGKMTISSLINDFILVAENEFVGGDFDDVSFEKQNLGWVIIDYDLWFGELPRMGDTIKISTKVVAFNNAFVYRQFFVENEKGKVTVAGMSSFIIMDLKKRKIKLIPKDFGESVKSTRIKHSIRFDKINSKNAVKNGHVIEISFFDIDSNKHVNNTRYIDWMENDLGRDFLLTDRKSVV